MTRLERVAFFVVTGGIALPIVAAAFGAWLDMTPAFLLAALTIVAAFVALRGRISAIRFPSGGRALMLAFLVVGVLATVRSVALATFMIDPARDGGSVLWFDPFYVRHSCFSGWYEGGRLAMRHVANIYRPELYGGPIGGRFAIDGMIYPSPFLLLPRALLSISDSFLVLRTLWFAIEAALLAGSLVAVGRWVGGEEGRRVLWAVPAVWLATPVLLTLQIGNFQLAALALTMLAMISFDRGRPASGGALLAFACLKIFPGVVIVPLLIRRRWRDLAWTGAFAAFYTAASVVWIGPAPLLDFLRYHLPRIASGSSWDWLELPQMARLVASNHSIPGSMLKLTQLGFVATGHDLVRIASPVYTLLVVALAVRAGFLLRGADRRAQARIWIALTGLAALQSPLIPDTYSLPAFLWLWSLVLPGLFGRPVAFVAGLLLWLPLATVLPIDGEYAPDGTVRVVLGLLVQGIAVGFALAQLIAKGKRAPTSGAVTT